MILDTLIYDKEDIINIAGGNEGKLNVIKEYFNINITIQGNNIICDDCSNQTKEKLENLFTFLLKISKKVSITLMDITYILKNMDHFDELLDLYLNRKVIINNFFGKPIYPKTIHQAKYLELINNNDIVFSIGKAGSGKTYLAIIMAVKMLKEGKIKKIILTRPAVEAGESLGFLPGDLKEKIDPYLRPLYDGLYDALGKEVVTDLIEKNVIEIAPLAYMRGRTLENACIILDEAQNTIKMQMKMILSRLGYNSKMIITGDITQIDLPHNIESGLKNAVAILNDIKGIGIIEFSGIDVIRHPLVNEILKRYDKE